MIKFNRIRIGIICCLGIVLCNSCTYSDETHDQNEFRTFLNELPLKQIEKFNYLDVENDHVINPHSMAIDRWGQMIIVDHTVWNIHLFSENGEYRTTVGGEGRGPGEYSGINFMSLSDDNSLYVLDKSLQRVTSYQVKKGNLELLNTFQLPNYMPLTMEYFYKSPSFGYVGIFRNFERALNKEGMNDTFKMYSLNDNFNTKEKITEFPGNETLKIDSYTDDNYFGITTNMQFCPDEDALFYSQTDKLTYHGYFLNSNKEVSGQATDYPDYSVTEFEKIYISESREFLFDMYPKIREDFESRRQLPYFSSMYLTNENIFWGVFYSGWDVLHILGMDRQSEEQFTIKVPSAYDVSNGFVIFGAYENKIYGIEYSDVGSSIFMAELE